VVRISPPNIITEQQADDSLELLYQVARRLGQRLQSTSPTRELASASR
jgi:hypothetical protein